MPIILSSSKKRGAIFAIKACVIFSLILCTFIFTPKASAAALWESLDSSVKVGSTDGTYWLSPFCDQIAGYVQCPIDNPPSAFNTNSVDLYIYLSPNIETGQHTLRIREYNDAAYTSLNNADFADYNIATSSSGWAKGTYSTGGTFDTSKYYKLFFISGEGSDWRGSSLGVPAFTFDTTPPVGPPYDYSTRIVSFSPENNATTSSPVSFALHAYINPADIAGAYEIQLVLHNIDQNVFLLSQFSPSDKYLINGFFATTSGDYYFATSTTLGSGNYTLEASIKQYIGWGWASIANPLSSVDKTIYHKFIVCDIGGSTCNGTVIGNLQQNMYDILAGAAGESTGTTTATSTIHACNPISNNYATAFLNTDFDVIKCALALATPDGVQLRNSLVSLRDDTFKHAPWGYLTRFVSILSASSTSPLPTFTATIIEGASTTDTISIDPGDMLSGGADLLSNLHDPVHGKTLRDVAEPIVLLSLALSVLFTIVADLMLSHRHSEHEIKQNNSKDI